MTILEKIKASNCSRKIISIPTALTFCTLIMSCSDQPYRQSVKNNITSLKAFGFVYSNEELPVFVFVFEKDLAAFYLHRTYSTSAISVPITNYPTSTKKGWDRILFRVNKDDIKLLKEKYIAFDRQLSRDRLENQQDTKTAFQISYVNGEGMVVQSSSSVYSELSAELYTFLTTDFVKRLADREHVAQAIKSSEVNNIVKEIQ